MKQAEYANVIIRWAWIPCPKECLDLLESVYIFKFEPQYNGGMDRDFRQSMPISYRDLTNPKFFNRKDIDFENLRAQFRGYSE